MAIALNVQYHISGHGPPKLTDGTEMRHPIIARITDSRVLVPTAPSARTGAHIKVASKCAEHRIRLLVICTSLVQHRNVIFDDSHRAFGGYKFSLINVLNTVYWFYW